MSGKITSRQKAKHLLPYFLFACGIIAFAVLFYRFITSQATFNATVSRILAVFTPIFLGLTITFFLTPAVSRMERLLMRFQSFLRRQTKLPLPKKYKNSTKDHHKLIRFLAMLFSYVLVFGSIVLAVVFIVPQLLDSLSAIINLISSTINEIIGHANALYDRWDQLPLRTYVSTEDLRKIVNSQLSTLTTGLQTFIRDLVPKVYNLVFSFASSLINLFLGIIISIYLVADRERFIRSLRRIVYSLLRKDRAMGFINFCAETVSIFRSFFIGKFVDSLLIGIICYFLMLILRLDYPLLIAFIVGITNVIPYFGPYLGAIPSALILLMSSPMQALIFIIMVLVLQQFDGNILGPYILGGTLGIKPFWIVFAVTVFGGFFGLFGMLVGVPLFTVIYTLFNRNLERRLAAKEIGSSEEYNALEEERLAKFATAVKPKESRNPLKRIKKNKGIS